MEKINWRKSRSTRLNPLVPADHFRLVRHALQKNGGVRQLAKYTIRKWGKPEHDKLWEHKRVRRFLSERYAARLQEALPPHFAPILRAVVRVAAGEKKLNHLLAVVRLTAQKRNSMPLTGYQPTVASFNKSLAAVGATATKRYAAQKKRGLGPTNPERIYWQNVSDAIGHLGVVFNELDTVLKDLKPTSS